MLRPLSKELQEIAEKELGEDPKRLEEDIKNIKEWMKQQPHINGREDDQWIVAFLRGCKFSLQLTKMKLDNSCALKSFWPSSVFCRDPFNPEIQQLLKLNVLLPLPLKKNWTGPRIVYTSFENLDFGVINIDAYIALNFMTYSILLLEDDNSTVSGVIIFNDTKNMPKNTIIHMTPSVVKNFSFCLQNVIPLRIKGQYTVNMPSFAEILFNLLKSMVSKKLQSRFFVCSEKNFEKIYDYIPKDCLPKEYGGDIGSLDEIRENWKKKVESYAEWYKEDKRYCTNESLRIGKPPFENDYGTEGSFRKLNVD